MSSPTVPPATQLDPPSVPARQCANCGAPLTGHYCSHCGQHDVEYCRSFRHFIAEVAENLFHFEGKFLVSVAWLIAKPGRLTKEFVSGRRQSQLNPLRFYIFATVLFFLGAHLLHNGHLIDFNRHEVDRLGKNFQGKSGEWIVGHRLSAAQKAELLRRVQQLQEQNTTVDLSKLNRLISDVQRDIPNPAAPEKAEEAPATTVKAHAKHRDEGWLTRVRSALEEKLSSGEVRVSDIYDELEHRIPTILFLGMPVFALILKLRYVGSGRYYLEHLIFSVHVHTWLFIVVMVATGYLGIAELVGAGFATAVQWAILAWAAWYLVAAFRTVYAQSWIKSALTASVLSVVYTGFLFLLAIAFFCATVVSIALE